MSTNRTFISMLRLLSFAALLLLFFPQSVVRRRAITLWIAGRSVATVAGITCSRMVRRIAYM